MFVQRVLHGFHRRRLLRNCRCRFCGDWRWGFFDRSSFHGGCRRCGFYHWRFFRWRGFYHRCNFDHRLVFRWRRFNHGLYSYGFSYRLGFHCRGSLFHFRLFNCNSCRGGFHRRRDFLGRSGYNRCYDCSFFRYGNASSLNGGFGCRFVDAGRGLSVFHGNAVLFNRCGDNRRLLYGFGLHFGFFNLSDRVAYPYFA